MLLLARFEMIGGVILHKMTGNALSCCSCLGRRFNLNGANSRPLSTKPVKLIYGAAAAMPGTFCTLPALHASWSTADSTASNLPVRNHRQKYGYSTRVKTVHRLKPTINTATPSAIPMVEARRNERNHTAAPPPTARSASRQTMIGKRAPLAQTPHQAQFRRQAYRTHLKLAAHTFRQLPNH